MIQRSGAYVDRDQVPPVVAVHCSTASPACGGPRPVPGCKRATSASSSRTRLTPSRLSPASSGPGCGAGARCPGRCSAGCRRASGPGRAGPCARRCAGSGGGHRPARRPPRSRRRPSTGSCDVRFRRLHPFALSSQVVPASLWPFMPRPWPVPRRPASRRSSLAGTVHVERHEKVPCLARPRDAPAARLGGPARTGCPPAP